MSEYKAKGFNLFESFKPEVEAALKKYITPLHASAMYARGAAKINDERSWNSIAAWHQKWFLEMYYKFF